MDLKSREMIAVAALASLGHREQLRHHVQVALGQGLSKAAVTEILMQIAIYAGIPRSLNALADCHDLLTQGDSFAACSRHS
jgi:alkylhydroperoxidase/carboxymuconolactone decarboxylase family protein YurZ